MNVPVITTRPDTQGRDVFEDVAATLAERRPRSDRPLSSTTYLIAMLPRTGSTALCSLLAQTGQHGMPAEYLNPRGPLQYWATELAARDLVEYLDTLRRERATANGVFGLKSTFDDFAPLLATSSASSLLGDIRFIYLTRSDLLRQAISEYLAEESGLWHRDRAGEPLNSKPTKGPDEVPFDETKILGIVDRLVGMQQAWERFFVLYGISPLRITYEDWCADTSAAVSGLAEFIGVPWTGPASLADANTSKLADERADSWVADIRRRFVL